MCAQEFFFLSTIAKNIKITNNLKLWKQTLNIYNIRQLWSDYFTCFNVLYTLAVCTCQPARQPLPSLFSSLSWTILNLIFFSLETLPPLPSSSSSSEVMVEIMGERKIILNICDVKKNAPPPRNKFSLHFLPLQVYCFGVWRLMLCEFFQEETVRPDRNLFSCHDKKIIMKRGRKWSEFIVFFDGI